MRWLAWYHGLETSLEDYEMATLGVPEMIVIFILALVLFGPKKLPEIGRTVGKAISEFRKASSELKDTFRNEMQQLEQETAPIKEAVQETASQYQYDSYNYDYSSYEYGDSQEYGSETTAASDTSSESASATQGAESSPEGAHSDSLETAAYEQAAAETGAPESAGKPVSQGDPHVSAEQKA